MTSRLDALALAEEIAGDSQSGKLSRELLTQGQTLHGKSLDYPDHLECMTPDGKVSLVNWRNDGFEEVICLL